MHCAVQLSAFLYRAMYSTMQQPLTRTAALKIEWSTDCLLNDTQKNLQWVYIHILNTIWIHSSFTILIKWCLPIPTVQYHNAWYISEPFKRSGRSDFQKIILICRDKL